MSRFICTSCLLPCEHADDSPHKHGSLATTLCHGELEEAALWKIEQQIIPFRQEIARYKSTQKDLTQAKRYLEQQYSRFARGTSEITLGEKNLVRLGQRLLNANMIAAGQARSGQGVLHISESGCRLLLAEIDLEHDRLAELVQSAYERVKPLIEQESTLKTSWASVQDKRKAELQRNKKKVKRSLIFGVIRHENPWGTETVELPVNEEIVPGFLIDNRNQRDAMTGSLICSACRTEVEVSGQFKVSIHHVTPTDCAQEGARITNSDAAYLAYRRQMGGTGYSDARVVQWFLDRLNMFV